VLATSCLQEECDSRVEYIAYEPVLVNADDFRTTIVATDARNLCTPSGFYVYGDYLLVVEAKEGLHVFDNSDPTNPRAISFVPVMGAAGLAVRNDILYINNYVDLVSFDISSPTAPVMVGRTEDVFEPYSIFTNDLGYEEMVVDYRETNAVQYLDCTDPRNGRTSFWQDDALFINVAETSTFSNDLGSGNNAGGNEQVGIGGSLARFTITNSTLYAVDESRLKAFDLSNASQPVFQGNVQLEWGVETIFPSGNELYIGTNRGMHIYDASDPLNPSHLSSIQHIESCDPVVVSGDRAYVTLRGGSFCGGFDNQLEIYDVRNPSNPNLMLTYPMDGPAGLTVADNKLFICQPGHNLKIYALLENGLRGEELNSVEELNRSMDVIGLDWLNRLIIRSENGIQQMTYNERGQLNLLSELDICAEL
jgi:hypothetical protein